MHPYEHKRLAASADKKDCTSEARKTSMGGRKLYQSPIVKAQIRREMKRADKAKAKREWLREAQEP